PPPRGRVPLVKAASPAAPRSTAMNKIVALALSAAVVLAGASPEALARTSGYAVTTVENPTEQTLYYSVRGGDGEWQQYSLAPGYHRVHWWPYNGGVQESPPLHVRFDYPLCDNEFWPKEYVLIRYACPSPDRWASKRYVFRK